MPNSLNIYLADADAEILDRLAAQYDTSKADIVRRALRLFDSDNRPPVYRVLANTDTKE